MINFPLQKFHYFFAFLGILSTSHGRWMKPEEAPSKILERKENIDIKADGSFTQKVTLRIGILKEGARESHNKFIASYVTEYQKFSFKKLMTVLNGKSYPVDPEMIEDKPIASEVGGFDQKNQVIAAFQKVEIGSEVHLSYEMEHFKNPFPGTFYHHFSFGLDGLEDENSHIHLESKIPLYIEVNDPTGALKVDRQEDGKKITIQLKKPLFHQTINEPLGAFAPARVLTWVSVSSMKSFDEMARTLSPAMWRVLRQPLPQSYQEIVHTVQFEKDEEKQINNVMSMLNERINYHGDWRTIKGMFTPRDLDVIEKTQLGDCKDFSISTAAILKKLGYQVFPTVVYRGIQDYLFVTKIPGYYFNHAILKAISPSGKSFWLDPTNFTSMCGRIYPDIAGRKALVFAEKTTSYEEIPSTKVADSFVDINTTMDIQGDGGIQKTFQIEIQGNQAIPMTGSGLYHHPESLKDMLFQFVANDRLDDPAKTMIMPPLKSRIVEPITLKGSFFQKNELLKTNLGYGIPLNRSNRAIEAILTVKRDGVLDILLEEPSEIKRTAFIKNMVTDNADVLNMNIDSPWLSLSRVITSDDSGIILKEHYILKKSVITKEDMTSDEFAKLKESLEKNVIQNALIFKNYQP
jgi:hypothetical protein